VRGQQQSNSLVHGWHCIGESVRRGFEKRRQSRAYPAHVLRRRCKQWPP
jgi:hypothetical protein